MKKIFKTLILSLVIINLSSAQNIDHSFFMSVEDFLNKNISNGLVNYSGLQSDKSLDNLILQIAEADLTQADAKTKQAFYINAYNLIVIDQVRKSYPLTSVQSKGGFFDRNKTMIAGENLTLNQLEKNKLLKTYGDARFHFVLVCGALGCPPITSFAYMPEKLDKQLDQQTTLALNDNNFIKATNGTVEISEIFKWYASDFGGRSNFISFINKYRNEPLESNVNLSYYTYDWTLNNIASNSQGSIEKPNNANRYVVSSTIPEGTVEVKIFNNLYSQKTGDGSTLNNRSSFFTTAFNALYGLSSRFNIGIAGRYRKVRNNALPSSPFSVFGSDSPANSRSGLTAIGPQIRYAPVPRWENFSVQSSFVFAIGDQLAGSDSQPYIDWSGPTWHTQLFNDFSIGDKFSLFTELDFLIEDIGSFDSGHNNRFSTPATLILSFNPTPKSTIYALSGFSPYWEAPFDYFVQAGLGAKYQITDSFELEVLYTEFTNKFLLQTNGQAQTLNFGIRFNL